MSKEINPSLRRLRKRVERALASGDRGSDVVRDLELMVRESSEPSPDVLFAHRQLAELRLEESPWQAALHLRHLIAASLRDDGVHALMGLCQALLGNFRSAISSYRRAIQIAPRNPWYHHNLGHLIDVGLGDANLAVKHLQLAYELQPQEDEIGASLAHCYGRLGRLEEAAKLAAEAVDNAPDNREHQVLLAWIEEGAPGRAPAGATQRPRVTPPGAAAQRALAAQQTDEQAREARPARNDVAATVADARAAGKRTSAGSPLLDSVVRLLAARMPEAGFAREHVVRAQALWSDYCSIATPSRIAKLDLYAAAIEYALAQIDGVPGVTQSSLARRYRVSAGSISSRYGEIRSTLSLVPKDPRYSVSAQA
jgi:tetratricopeptide (TPR) repeat protein